MMLTYFGVHGRVACLAMAATMLTACPGKGGETDGDTETSTGEPTTGTGTTADTPTTGGTMSTATVTAGTMGGTMTDSTTDGPDTTTTGGTMGGMTTVDETTAGTTAGTTEGTTEGTTGVVPGDLDEACMSACDKFFECVDPAPFPDIDACKAECAAAAGDQQGCIDAYVEFNGCIGTLTCPQFEDAFVNEEFGPCTDAFIEVNDACQGNVCQGFGGQGPDGCSIGQQCPNEPMQEYVCEGNTCACVVDGQPTGVTCPAAGFCQKGFDAQAAAANACCGFEF